MQKQIFATLGRQETSQITKEKGKAIWTGQGLEQLVKIQTISKECKRQFRRAEWDHVNNIIHEGLQENNSKPFWQYVK